jgi:acylglycerol lipase
MYTKVLTTPGLGGLDLHAQAWLPDVPPRAVVVVAHGLGEHSGRYARLAADLVGHGHAVYALDHRGHGKSPGRRANIERFDHVVADFCAFAGRAGRQHIDVPVFVLGHSMGGAIAFAAALRMQQTLRGLVLSAPALGLDAPPPAAQRVAAEMLSVIAPNIGVLRLSPAHLSRDPVVVHEYERDPLVHHGAVPARTVVELLRAMETFPAQAPRLRLPTLVLHGTADRLVPLAGARPVCQAIDPAFRTLRTYDGLYHEVLNEPERAKVLQDVLHWLAKV